MWKVLYQKLDNDHWRFMFSYFPVHKAQYHIAGPFLKYPVWASMWPIVLFLYIGIGYAYCQTLTDRSHVMAAIFSPCGFGMLSRCWTIFWKSPFKVASRSRATIPGVPSKNRILPAQEERYDKAYPRIAAKRIIYWHLILLHQNSDRL